MDRMLPLDATFLHLEDGVTHMHVASCAVLEGPAPPFDELLRHFAGRLPLVPRYRQKVRFVPLDLGRPVWVDDPHFDPEYHVRRAALPAPGGSRELELLFGELMSTELDRRRPLWQVWVVEGLADGSWALVSKVHHCMVDGVSGVGLLDVLLDHEPVPSAPAPDTWTPAPEPSPARLAVDAMRDLALSPYEQLRAVRAAVRRPAQVWERARTLASGFRAYAGAVAPTPRTSLDGTIGPHRRWAPARASLDDVKGIRRAFGGTVNDVVVTVVAGGYRRLILERGESTDDVRLRSLIPVSVRPESALDVLDNRVSAIFYELPTAIADPVERLGVVSRDMTALKSSHEAEAGEALTSVARYAPNTVVAQTTRLVSRLMHRAAQRSMNTVVTNVPGPREPLYLVGRRMLEYLPYVPIGGGVRTGVAIVSYCDRLAFGVTGDFDTVPDVRVVCDGIEADVAELARRALAASAPPTAGRRRRPAA